MDQAHKPRGRKYYTGPLLQESRESSLSFLNVITVNISCSGFPPGTVEVRETCDLQVQSMAGVTWRELCGDIKAHGIGYSVQGVSRKA